jgi:poly-gamma-glutamate synthesis protein (capsule biosynthesis protein)
MKPELQEQLNALLPQLFASKMKANKIVIFVVLIAAVLTAAICYFVCAKQNNLIIKQNSITAAISNIQEKKYIQLLFVGDLMFDRGIRYYAQKNGGPGRASNEFIFDKISAALLSNDLVVANLEGPITDNKSVSAGTIVGSTDNYFFTFDPSLAETLFQENIRLVDLGNNHILNFGQAGLDSTKKYLDDANVSYFGLPAQAGAPGGNKSVIENISSIKIAFVSYNEFSSNNIDDEKKATIDEIKKIKLETDIVIVFSHWGIEYSAAPTDEMKNLARQFIDAGADLVIGSHPHVIEPVEVYNGNPPSLGAPARQGRIYYSLGNFIFDQYFNENVRNGLGVIVKIDKSTKQMEFSEGHFYLDNNGQTLLR